MELPQLIQECKRQRTGAQKVLYERFCTMGFLLCRRYVRNDEVAEEMLHNGFLKCFSSLPQFRYTSSGAFIAWFKKILVNECLMHLRRHHSFLQVALDDIPVIPADDDLLDGLAATEIFGLIAQLPTGYRTVFNLAVIEGLAHKEIAAMLEISEGTSKSQLSKARQLLQQFLIRSNPDHAIRQSK